MIIVQQVVPDTTPTDTGGFTLPLVEPRLGLGVMLTGTDGSTWDLYNGPVRALAGSSGFGAPTPEHWWRVAPALDGSTWAGYRVPQRDINLPVYIHESTSLGWRDTDAAFFKALNPSSECTLIVATPDGAVRSLPVRFAGGADVDFDVDPLIMRYAAYALTFSAADPYWQGSLVHTSFSVAGSVTTLFPGPPFNINSAYTTGTGTIANPGDVVSWPKWTVNGPYTGFTVGVGATTVVYSGTKAAGQSVTIDTDPRRRTVLNETGADEWVNLTTANFEPIPPGGVVTLSLSVTGATTSATSIDMNFIPRYRRAW